MKETNKAEIILNRIQNEKFAIWGTGYMGKRLYSRLNNIQMLAQFMYFVTSEGSDKKYENKDVLSISQLDAKVNVLLLLAVHESIKDEIINSLESINYSNYIWIGDVYYELLAGKPLRKNEKVKLSTIWKNNKTYNLVYKFLAAEYCYGMNDFGKNLYIKCLSQYCQRSTAEKRFMQFEKLIVSVKENGLNPEEPALLTDEFEIIDGAHRIALAMFHKQNSMVCDIYISNLEEGYHTTDEILTDDGLEKIGLTELEKAELRRVFQMFCLGYDGE